MDNAIKHQFCCTVYQIENRTCLQVIDSGVGNLMCLDFGKPKVRVTGHL